MAKLSIFTWGSCRQGYAEIIYPKRVDLSEPTGRDGIHEVEISGLCKIKYENRDSSKNLNREVEVVDVYAPFLVIRHHEALSCGKSFDKVYKVYKNGGEIRFEELEPKEELVEVENGKFKVLMKRAYVEVDGQKLYLKESEVRREVCVDRLAVKVLQRNGRVYVLGDTYYVKDRLKEMKYRWNPNVKAWFKDSDVNKVVEELESIGVQVVVE